MPFRMYLLEIELHAKLEHSAARLEGSPGGSGCVPRAAEDGAWMLTCWQPQQETGQRADTGPRTFTEISIKREITTLYLD